jgi:hypothetical protein
MPWISSEPKIFKLFYKVTKSLIGYTISLGINPKALTMNNIESNKFRRKLIRKLKRVFLLRILRLKSERKISRLKSYFQIKSLKMKDLLGNSRKMISKWMKKF